MQAEIEVKFLNVNFEAVRVRLKELGAHCEYSMRLMRRALFDFPDNRFQKNNQSRRLRVRDEGDKITVTFKSKGTSRYSNEVETTIGSFETMVAVFKAIGLKNYSFQESKRETWHYKDVEIVLDEWPWVKPYIEIGGPNEAAIKAAANDMGFDWKQARYGSADTAYQAEYPGLTDAESIGDIPEVRFDRPLPEYLRKRQTA